MTKLLGALGDYAETCKNIIYLTGQDISAFISPNLKFPCTDDTIYWDVTRGAVWQSFTSVTERHAVSSVSAFLSIYTTVD